jgi:hypothetical protein
MRVGSKGFDGGKARAAARSRGVRLDIVTPRSSEPTLTAARHYSLLDHEGRDSLSATGVDAANIAGTVGAKVSFERSEPYDSKAESLTHSAPLAALRSLVRSESSGPRFNPADLVAELNEINAEIHRIMSQVEKAVARLVTS